MSSEEEVFICDGYHWAAYLTEEGYPYYLTTDEVTFVVHTQWGDPRIYGKYIEEGNNDEAAQDEADASSLSLVAQPPRSPFYSALSSPMDGGHFFPADKADFFLDEEYTETQIYSPKSANRSTSMPVKRSPVLPLNFRDRLAEASRHPSTALLPIVDVSSDSDQEVEDKPRFRSLSIIIPDDMERDEADGMESLLHSSRPGSSNQSPVSKDEIKSDSTKTNESIANSVSIAEEPMIISPAEYILHEDPVVYDGTSRAIDEDVIPSPSPEDLEDDVKENQIDLSEHEIISDESVNRVESDYSLQPKHYDDVASGLSGTSPSRVANGIAPSRVDYIESKGNDKELDFIIRGAELNLSSVTTENAQVGTSRRLTRVLDNSFIDSSLTAPIIVSRPLSSSTSATSLSNHAVVLQPVSRRRSSRGMWTTVIDVSLPALPKSSSPSAYDDYSAVLRNSSPGYGIDASSSSQFEPYAGRIEDEKPKHISVWAKFFENALKVRAETAISRRVSIDRALVRSSDDVVEDYADWPAPLDNANYMLLMDSILNHHEEANAYFELTEMLSKALLFAILNADAAAVDKLLTMEANVFEVDDLIRTPLHHACKVGEAASVALLCDYGAEINARDIFGRTGLHIACVYNRPNVARYLLETAAEVDAQDDRYNSPLHLACRLGHLECCQLLLYYGASLEGTNSLKLNPMGEAKSAYAKGVDTREIIDFLRDQFMKRSPKPTPSISTSVINHADHNKHDKIGSAQKKKVNKWGPPRAVYSASPPRGFLPPEQRVQSSSDSEDSIDRADSGGQGLLAQAIWMVASTMISILQGLFVRPAYTRTRRRSFESRINDVAPYVPIRYRHFTYLIIYF